MTKVRVIGFDSQQQVQTAGFIVAKCFWPSLCHHGTCVWSPPIWLKKPFRDRRHLMKGSVLLDPPFAVARSVELGRRSERLTAVSMFCSLIVSIIFVTPLATQSEFRGLQ